MTVTSLAADARAAGVLAAGQAWLFCPGDRPDRFGKAAAAADVVILDLEDGVASADRAGARKAVMAADLDPTRTLVRVNPAGSAEFAADLDAVGGSTFSLVMLAKTSSPQDVCAVTKRLPAARVAALCETPAGIVNAASIAATPGVFAMMWGAEDLIAGLGGQSSRLDDGRYRDVCRYARSAVLMACAAAGVAALDSVFLNIGDLDGLAVETSDAAASGFAAKVCIHPSQAAVVRAAYRPSYEQVEWARRVLAAAVGGPGVFAFEGRMVDGPVLAQARRILSRAEVGS